MSSALSASKILIKGSAISGKVPALSSLEYRELAVNSADGIIFTKTTNNEIVTFLNSTTLQLLSTAWQDSYTTVAQNSAIWESNSSNINENVNTLVKASSADWNIIGDRYFTTSISTNSINKGTKVFAVSANLSYIPTQDITIVHDHDIENHMHGTVLDYNSSTGSLTADITSRTGSGSYSDWRINLGGTPTFVDSLIATNNLSDVASPSTALMNLSGVSRTELRSLSGSWQHTFTTYSSNSASYATSSFVQSNFLPLSGGTSTTTLSVQELSASKFSIGDGTGTAALFVGTNSKVGINTESPNKTLTVNGDVGISGPLTVNEDIEVTDFTKGIILRSPNNSRWRITVTNSGTLSATAL